MSEFLNGYNPEKENLSPQEEHPSSDGNPSSPETAVLDTQSPDSQSQITLEQTVALANENSEIKEFLAQQNLSPEELTDLYQALQKTINNNSDNITLDLVKKITENILGPVSPTRERAPFSKRALSLVSATLFAFLGPIAFKNHSASAAENNNSTKSKAPTGIEEQAPETTTTTDKNIAALVDQDLTETTNALEQETALEEETVEVKTVDEWTFDYKKDVHPSLRRDWPESDFNKLVADIKSTDYYERQIVLIRSYSRLGEPISTAAVGTAWTIAFNSAETQRFRETLAAPSVKEVDGYTAYQTLLYLYNFYQNEVVDTADVTSVFNSIFNDSTDERWVAYEDPDALEENKATVAAFAKHKFEINGKAISLKDLNKKINALIKKAKKLASNRKNVPTILALGEEMIVLMEMRRQAFIEVFLQLKDDKGKNFTLPKVELSDYPNPNTPDITTELGLERK